jgi:5-methylcytosine-specific restriction endonuclease McrA
MPIKPENRELYPDNWPDIRRRILNRATPTGCVRPLCEQCGVPNRTVVVRLTADRSQWRTMAECMIRLDESGDESNEYDHDPVTIVLTVAHLDHDPGNNDDSNLAAWCQRCHLNYDRGTKTRNHNQTELFEKDGQNESRT